jgi:hypothetical protein
VQQTFIPIVSTPVIYLAVMTLVRSRKLIKVIGDIGDSLSLPQDRIFPPGDPICELCIDTRR